MHPLLSLRWQDLAPTRPFDPCAARAEVEAVLLQAAGGIAVGRRAKKHKLWDRWELNSELDRVLITEYGAWAAGWSWGTCGGGLVPCTEERCPKALARVLRIRHPSVSQLADMALGQLGEWRQVLTMLSELFAALRNETRALTAEHSVERAAARILAFVVDRTGVSDAWYQSLEACLCWYAEDSGIDPDRARPIVRYVVESNFRSWCAPRASDAQVAFQTLAQRLAHDEVRPQSIGLLATRRYRSIGEQRAAIDATTSDALEEWLELRAPVFQRETTPLPSRLTPVRADGHLRYIESKDRDRNPMRADRLRSALELSRKAAADRRALDLELLTSWQRVVLGVEHVELRSTPAFAKGGRERYGVIPNLRARFEAALAEASDSAASTVDRAARVYLDVCFFHPFEDGNARAARLALDFVLAREGLALHSAEPIFALARDSGDPYAIWSLSRVIQAMLGVAAPHRTSNAESA